MTDLLAILTLMFWPVVPLFWIPVHFATRFFRRLGLLTYLLFLIVWIPLAYIIYENRHFLLQFRLELPFILNIVGFVFLFLGTFLHLWTARLLGLWVIIGVPEISRFVIKRLTERGPFSLVRHPTYLAHTLILLGVFFITEVVSVGIVTVVDFGIVNAIIIPLEEKELSIRFGQEYEIYKKKVPNGFFPWRRSKQTSF